MDLMESLEYVRAYIDDLLVITRGTLEDHLVKLGEVLRRLREAGLKVNADKSTFCALEIEYIKGEKNVVADALSRLPTEEIFLFEEDNDFPLNLSLLFFQAHPRGVGLVGHGRQTHPLLAQLPALVLLLGSHAQQLVLTCLFSSSSCACRFDIRLSWRHALSSKASASSLEFRASAASLSASSDSLARSAWFCLWLPGGTSSNWISCLRIYCLSASDALLSNVCFFIPSPAILILLIIFFACMIC